MPIPDDDVDGAVSGLLEARTCQGDAPAARAGPMYMYLVSSFESEHALISVHG